MDSKGVHGFYREDEKVEGGDIVDGTRFAETRHAAIHYGDV